MTRRIHKGFTLIELLVVVAILALLISILLPSLGRAREQAKALKCGTNMRSAGMQNVIFAEMNGGRSVGRGATPLSSGGPTILEWNDILNVEVGSVGTISQFAPADKPVIQISSYAAGSLRERSYSCPTYNASGAFRRCWQMNYDATGGRNTAWSSAWPEWGVYGLNRKMETETFPYPHPNYERAGLNGGQTRFYIAEPDKAYHYGALLKRFNPGQLLIIEVEDRTDGITYQRSDTLMTTQDFPKTWSYGGGLFSFRHMGKMNALFMDNSVQRLVPKDWPNRPNFWSMPDGAY